jgi:hypothetical protein
MSIAATLPQAAGLSFDNLQVKWLANQLKNALGNFWPQLLSQFPESSANNHPVSNWLALIANLQDQMTQSSVPIDQLTLAAEYIYRICWMTEALRVQSLITAPQAAAVLGAYNGSFG